MNELFREHLEAPKGNPAKLYPSTGEVTIIITPHLDGWTQKNIYSANPAPELEFEGNNFVGTTPEALAAKPSTEQWIKNQIGIALFPWQRSMLSSALRHKAWKEQDPKRYDKALQMTITTRYNFEECWWYLAPQYHIYFAPGPEWAQWAPKPLPTTEVGKRKHALAAKEAKGSGPPSSASWRGKERATKFRSQ